MFCLSAIVKVVCAVVVALFEGILPSKISSDIRLASIHREKGCETCVNKVSGTRIKTNLTKLLNTATQ